MVKFQRAGCPALSENGSPRIGFMQGRLSSLVEGRIQAFPAAHWQSEFPQGAEIGFGFLEWTLDQEGLRENPLLTLEGRSIIRKLSRRSGLRVASVTLDCIMQAPFYKTEGRTRHGLLEDLTDIIDACEAAKIRTVVVPLVDEGGLHSTADEAALREGLKVIDPLLLRAGIQIAFECDFEPEALSRFIETLPRDRYGITYDIGNSAALGFDAASEFAAYGHRIRHVHVKDRVAGGTTVPLGQGNADFTNVFNCLARFGYDGTYVLQTARAKDEDHAGVLQRYRAQTLEWIGAASREVTAA